MPVPVDADHTFAPVSARKALKLPIPSPWNTRLPAVASVPPFQGYGYSTRHISFFATGSQAFK